VALDLIQLLPQIQGAVGRLKERGIQARQRLNSALSLFLSLSSNWQEIKRRITLAKTTWLVAGIEEEWDKVHPLPPCPSDYAVLAVDGSHIPPDQHSPISCYLINLGVAHLQYGKEPRAQLKSRPSFLFEDDDLVIVDPSRLREQAIEGVLLGIKRSIEEMRGVVASLKEGIYSYPTLALMDGSLILWGLSGKAYPPFVKETLLDGGFLPAIEEVRRLSRGRKVALAGYISFPHSTEVVNILRLALCPYDIPNCDRYCRGKEAPRDCDTVAGVEDRELFAPLLHLGERSAIFLSRSSVILHYGQNQIHFFYIKLEDEIARVEIPRWVAEDKGLVDLVHAVVFEQCRLGRGYPVALTEAHHKAVLSPMDREQFWVLIGETLAQGGLPSSFSPKSRSKRMPLV